MLQNIWTHEPSPQRAAVVMTPAVEKIEDEPRSSAGKYHLDGPRSSTKFGYEIHVPEAGNWGKSDGRAAELTPPAFMRHPAGTACAGFHWPAISMLDFKSQIRIPKSQIPLACPLCP